MKDFELIELAVKATKENCTAKDFLEFYVVITYHQFLPFSVPDELARGNNGTREQWAAYHRLEGQARQQVGRMLNGDFWEEW